MLPVKKEYLKLFNETKAVLEPSAHCIDHTLRVYNLCRSIGRNYDIIERVLYPAAILHDIGRIKEDDDTSGKICHAKESVKIAIPILRETGYSKEEIKQISHCILTHRYRTDNMPQIIEAKILFDSDKLDILGAIGITRGLMWFGKNNGQMRLHDVSIKEYVKQNLGGSKKGRLKRKDIHTIFYEYETKTRYIPNQLYTKEAKQIAKERITFMKMFISKLKEEILSIDSKNILKGAFSR